MVEIIVGIDEVGRGPWAGPLVAAAVALAKDQTIDGVNDSKLLTKTKRSGLIESIKKESVAIGIGWVNPRQIDQYGLTRATSLAMQRAVENLAIKFNLAVIDGNIQYLKGEEYRCEVKADQKYQAVAAASIIAKVARDSYMEKLSRVYPGYGFEDHVGYGTSKHKQALAELGVCGLHRLSFKPIQEANVSRNRQTSRS